MPGTKIFPAEVTNISPHCFWLLLGHEELAVPFSEFPWFKNATIEQLADVRGLTDGHLYWPQLDIDLSVESIRRPADFPLKSKVVRGPTKMPRKINIEAAFAGISDYWSPRVGGDINDMQIKFVKLRGDFHWHHHQHEDELFLVIQGTLRMKLRAEQGGDVLIGAGEYLIVPKGVEHCPEAVTEEVHCLLLEPKTTVNTGNLVNERTRTDLKTI